jgi:rfaE bifunctional protein nucleotidyltransferase chain/domain
MKSIDSIRSKIVQREVLPKVLEQKRAAGQKIIFTNGCFDILHRGHIEYLSQASDLGDCFVIGLNNDESVRQLKGESRPAIDEVSRALTLASFEFVDYVVLFGEENPSELIRIIRPDYWVKGGDYQHFEELPEYRALLESGGNVKLIPFVEGYSTTDIYKKIQDQVKK